jgi:DNA-binding response OmpR family regulator
MAFKKAEPHRVSAGCLVLDRPRFEVHVGRTEILLTPREFELLWELVSMMGQVVTRESLMATVWQQEVYVSRTVDSHIATVRKKLGLYGQFIETVWGLGYRMRNPARHRSVLPRRQRRAAQVDRHKRRIRP